MRDQPVSPFLQSRMLWRGFFLLNWVVILWFWWNFSGQIVFSSIPDTAIAFGRLSGLAATYMILLQFFFMGRTPWLERVFGLDRLSRMHHKNGKRGFLLLLLHPILLIWGNGVLSENSFFQQAVSLLRIDEILLAAFSLALFVAVVASSIYVARTRLEYEIWYLIHLIAYLAVFLALPHQIELGTSLLSSTVFYMYWIALYVFVFANHLLFRIARPLLLLRRHGFAVERIERENHNTVSIYISGRALDRFSIRPGQFMILRFLAKGYRWQAHPFSVSSVPDGRTLRVTVKELGDFTRRIASVPPGTRMIIDGPYGVFTDVFGMSHKRLFIAGGIGITPIRGLFEEALAKNESALLLYANRTRKDIVFKDELESLSQRTSARIVHILSEESAPGAETGRVDEEKLRRLVPDILERDVYLCGPSPMMDALIVILRKMGIPPARLHYERFSL